jgi:hypothetical protein
MVYSVKTTRKWAKTNVCSPDFGLTKGFLKTGEIA